jgi:hypothetical protein
MTDHVDALRHEVAALRAELRELRDLEAIKQLKAAYFQHVDAQDWERWGRDVLADDIEFDLGPVVEHGRDAVVALVSSTMAGARSVHHGHTPVITLTGPDTATGVWAMQDYVSMFDRAGEPVQFRGYGHYLEEYVRTPDGWRISVCRLRRLRVDYEEGAAP